MSDLVERLRTTRLLSQRNQMALQGDAAAEIEWLRAIVARTMSDPQRLLWRDDVEGICPTPGVCWEYGDTARCGPCAIKQASKCGVEENMSLPNLPDVYRLRTQRDDAYNALRSIAEGNLGDLPWQADYETIKTVTMAAIPPEHRTLKEHPRNAD